MKMRVEIPKGSFLKYEKDKDTDDLVVDRVLNLAYPYSYGYFEDTLAEDGDPVDVFLMHSDLIDTPVVNSIVNVVPIALVEFEDNGEIDNKIIAVFYEEEGTAKYLFNKALAKIKYFLAHYKPDGDVTVGNVVMKEETLKYIEKCKV